MILRKELETRIGLMNCSLEQNEFLPFSKIESLL